MRRTPPTFVALLAATLTFVATSPAQDDEGAGTRIGGDVSSTLSLDLLQTGATVRAVVTTTEPDSRLSVASADGRSGLTARAAGPYAPIDPAFGLTLLAWDDVLAGRTTTLHLKSAPHSAPVVLVTLSAALP
jgi:hypothetical protein